MAKVLSRSNVQRVPFSPTSPLRLLLCDCWPTWLCPTGLFSCNHFSSVFCHSVAHIQELSLPYFIVSDSSACSHLPVNPSIESFISVIVILSFRIFVHFLKVFYIFIGMSIFFIHCFLQFLQFFLQLFKHH